jgi:hypothetical protein
MFVTKPSVSANKKPIIFIVVASATTVMDCYASGILLISGRVSVLLPIWLSIVTTGCVGSAKLAIPGAVDGLALCFKCEKHICNNCVFLDAFVD